MGWCIKLYCLGSALEAETETLRWAIQVLSGFGYKDVTFETDSLVLKRLISGEEEVWPKMRPLLQEIASMMATNQGFDVVFTPRSGNKVADRIAKETTTFTSFVPKLYSLSPMWLQSCAQTDKSVICI